MSKALTATVLLCAAFLFGCAQEAPKEDTTETETNHESTEMDAPAVTSAIVVLNPATPGGPTGTLLLTVDPNGVKVTGQVTGLAPGSEHGFHIHEFGDLTATDGTSLGSHYNPMGVDHGLPSDNDEARHVGDFGNIKADDNGVAAIDKVFPGVKLAEVLGRGVVVHEKPDDGGQPTGNAGGRIAFGVIGVAKSE